MVKIKAYCISVIPFNHSAFVKNPIALASSFHAKHNITIYKNINESFIWSVGVKTEVNVHLTMKNQTSLKIISEGKKISFTGI